MTRGCRILGPRLGYGDIGSAISRCPRRVEIRAAHRLLAIMRGRGLWRVAAFGAGLLALTLLSAPDLPALPFVGATWVICAALAGEPLLRLRH